MKQQPEFNIDMAMLDPVINEALETRILMSDLYRAAMRRMKKADDCDTQVVTSLINQMLVIIADRLQATDCGALEMYWQIHEAADQVLEESEDDFVDEIGKCSQALWAAVDSISGRRTARKYAEPAILIHALKRRYAELFSAKSEGIQEIHGKNSKVLAPVQAQDVIATIVSAASRAFIDHFIRPKT